MRNIYFFADNQIFKVTAINGGYIDAIDKTGWGASIPLTRVERFCNEHGSHISVKMTDKLMACSCGEIISSQQSMCDNCTYNDEMLHNHEHL